MDPLDANKQIERAVAEIETGLANAVRAAALDGSGVLRVRCQIPFTLSAPGGAFRFLQRDNAAPVARAAKPPGEVDDDPDMDECAIVDRIEGPSSSTSVDWYRTRMTLTCLEEMAAQFRAGVDYLPRHHGFLDSVEWDQVIGRTVDARIERADVREPAPGEAQTEQFVLYTTTDLYSDSQLAKKLIGRIRGGRAPGQSIGGWFNELAVKYDDDGNVQYPIDVLSVRLDHLAAVRSPANPDADRVWLAVERGIRAGIAARRAPEPAVVHEPAVVASTDPLFALDAAALRAAFALSISGPGASAPAPAPAIPGRATPMEITMTEQEIAELLRSTVAGALAPVMAEIETLKTARSAAPAPAPTPTPDPTPAPAPDAASAELAELRAKLAASEAETARLRAQPQPVAHRGAVAPSLSTAPAPSQIPDMHRVGAAGDMRAIAPVAARRIARGAFDVRDREIPCLVWQCDGLEALAEFAKASTETNAVNVLIEKAVIRDASGTQIRALTADATHIGPNGHDHGVYDRNGVLRTAGAKGQIDLQRMLSDIIFAADNDGILG